MCIWPILKILKEQLSSKEKFYSSLTGKKISDKEYEHVLNKFEMKTMKNYYHIYLKCDVLLLPDVFEKCINNSLQNYGLWPSHYQGLSGEVCCRMQTCPHIRKSI